MHRAGRAAALLRPAVRDPRAADYTRLRTDLTRERTRHWSRLEKLPEDALIKVPAVASTMTTKSVRDMIEALIAGQRSPRAIADLARGRMRVKRAALIEALTGRFDQDHAELAQMLLDQIDALSAQIDTLTGRIEKLTGAMPAARGVNADGTTGPGAGTGPDAAVRPAAARLDEIPGISQAGAHAHRLRPAPAPLPSIHCPAAHRPPPPLLPPGPPPPRPPHPPPAKAPPQHPPEKPPRQPPPPPQGPEPTAITSRPDRTAPAK